MSKELSLLEHLEFIRNYEIDDEHKTLNMDYACKQSLDIIETALKRLETVEEENKLLRENNENLDEIYYDTWYACERLKENRYYALMFVDDVYCLVNTKDNKFDVIDTYKIKSNRIIDNDTQKKLKALEIIKKKQVNVFVLLHCGDLETYNDMIADNRNLTQEEYDLLREVLL